MHTLKLYAKSYDKELRRAKKTKSEKERQNAKEQMKLWKSLIIRQMVIDKRKLEKEETTWSFD